VSRLSVSTRESDSLEMKTADLLYGLTTGDYRFVLAGHRAVLHYGHVTTIVQFQHSVDG
jgi:hypothetical protein